MQEIDTLMNAVVGRRMSAEKEIIPGQDRAGRTGCGTSEGRRGGAALQAPVHHIRMRVMRSRTQVYELAARASKGK